MFANTIPTLVKQVNYQPRHAHNGFYLKRKKKSTGNLSNYQASISTQWIGSQT